MRAELFCSVKYTSILSCSGRCMGDSGSPFREEKLSPLAPDIHAVQEYECKYF